MKIQVNRANCAVTELTIDASAPALRDRKALADLLLETAHGWHGWVVLCQPLPAAEARHLDPLGPHAEWLGPVKHVAWPAFDCERGERNERVDKRLELYCNGSLAGGEEAALDDELGEEVQAFRGELAQSIASIYAGDAFQTWSPPPAQQVAQWLQSTGHEPTIDEENNLRLTVKRLGAAGQMRIVLAEGRMRFTLPLGKWSRLEPESEAALRRLAGEANQRTRLARIRWTAGEKHHACVAEVDLTGLPWSEPAGACRLAFWQAMVVRSVACLATMLNQLSIELGMLADPKNIELARLVAAGASES